MLYLKKKNNFQVSELVHITKKKNTCIKGQNEPKSIMNEYKERKLRSADNIVCNKQESILLY